VNPEDIVFCKNIEIMCAEGDKVVAIAQNDGIASSGKNYNQVYAHIATVRDGKITKLIEFFDTNLANQALWKPDMNDVTPDEGFSFSQIC
jgi:ketosteroid isomerase-like protein